MKTSLTPKFIDAAKSATAQTDYFDVLCPGLSIRVTDKGRKTWSFTYTSPVDGKRSRMSLGLYPGLSLADARIKATECKGLIEKGEDPALVATSLQFAEKTVSDIFGDWVEMCLKPKGRRTIDEITRRFTANVKPIVGSVPVAKFRIDPHLNAVVDPIVKRGAPIQANRVFSDLRSLFNFAVKRGAIQFSPIANADQPAPENAKERWLSTAEIETVWALLPHVFPRSKSLVTILKLCLATGQRVGEVLGMTRDEIDLQARIWTIPAERVKNKREHVVPLNALAMELVVDAMSKTNSRFLFPDDSGEDCQSHHIVNKALQLAQKKTAKAPMGKFGIPYWTPHDLRRSVATQMSLEENALAIPELHISHVLNHISVTKASITARIYNKNTYLAEKKAALDKWGEFLAKLVGHEAHPLANAA